MNEKEKAIAKLQTVTGTLAGQYLCGFEHYFENFVYPAFLQFGDIAIDYAYEHFIYSIGKPFQSKQEVDFWKEKFHEMKIRAQERKIKG